MRTQKIFQPDVRIEIFSRTRDENEDEDDFERANFLNPQCLARITISDTQNLKP